MYKMKASFPAPSAVSGSFFYKFFTYNRKITIYICITIFGFLTIGKT